MDLNKLQKMKTCRIASQIEKITIFPLKKAT
jgi:hypothetical protein